jgi:hypothetical protein
MEREALIETGTIQRPTVLERKIHTFATYLLTLEDHCMCVVRQLESILCHIDTWR